MASLTINLNELDVYKIAVERLIEMVEELKKQQTLTHILNGTPTEDGEYLVAYSDDINSVVSEEEDYENLQWAVLWFENGVFGWVGTDEDPDEFYEDDSIAVFFWMPLPKISTQKKE